MDLGRDIFVLGFLGYEFLDNWIRMGEFLFAFLFFILNSGYVFIKLFIECCWGKVNCFGLVVGRFTFLFWICY